MYGKKGTSGKTNRNNPSPTQERKIQVVNEKNSKNIVTVLI
jgi:hypothetical protein